MENNSLKEYYIKLHTLYTNAVNMLTAINQSLTTNASEVSMEIYDNNNATTVKIPSFLYLDNKLEQLETTISNLFDMPNSGEAWFSNDGNMYKLELIRATTAPLSPDIDTTNIAASFNTNNFIKDLVNPRTFLKVNITNLPNNIEQMYMKKIVMLNTNLYSELSKLDISTYDEYKAALYKYKSGIDYEEYDSVLDLPIKQDKYVSEFEIDSIIDNGTTTDEDNHVIYTIKLNTLEYKHAEDSSQVYTLSIGDYLSIGNEYAIYKIIDIDYTMMEVTIVELIGHIALQPNYENSAMTFKLYNYDYSAYKYVEVPLEENPYIIVFLGTIYNGIRSNLSEAMPFNLNYIYMTNPDGSYMKDANGNNVSYIEYYNQYCNNIGDLILGLTQSAYPQLSNYNAYQLKQLQDSDEIVPYISGTFNGEDVLTVMPINSHIFEDDTIDNIKNYHSQKTALQAELNTLTENINTVNNQLINTDWSQEASLSQDKLQADLQKYYSDRLVLERQLTAVIGELNTLTSANNVSAATKYRVRGVTNIAELETYIKSITNSKVNLIGLEVEYKYKSISKTTTNVSNINNNIFTDWNRLNNIDRQRKLIFNEATNAFDLEFVNYESSSNIIKWNQIDIPINPNEDVIIRIRYKYNIGQPFINIYSPWSEELTVKFPTEFEDKVEVAKIIETNENDTISAKFTSKLINDGYEEHIVNKVIANNQTFFHMPENIYSGFNTSENNLISLKDKLTLMCAEIDSYKNLVEHENQKKFTVYLEYDSKSVPIYTGSTNKFNITNIDHISDYFIRKDMNLVIKNTGSVTVNLYSILPGNFDTPLVLCNYDYYKTKINDYYRVPVFIDGQIAHQTLGQWIYFRERNIYTGKSIYYNSENQIKYDIEHNHKILTNTENIFYEDNIQLGLPNKYFKTEIQYTNNYLGFINKDGVHNVKNSSNSVISDKIEDYYYNDNITTPWNTVIYKYEDIYGVKNEQNNGAKIYLTNTTSISKFTSEVNTNNNNLSDTTGFDGAFLFVNLDSSKQIITDGSEKGNYEIEVGKSVSIPIVFEYFLSKKQNITKTLMFDLRPSLLNNPITYTIEITANYDNSLDSQLANEYDN